MDDFNINYDENFDLEGYLKSQKSALFYKENNNTYFYGDVPPIQNEIYCQVFPMTVSEDNFSRGLIPKITPITPVGESNSITTEELYEMLGFLKTQIGKTVNMSLAITDKNIMDLTGVLIGIGKNYVLLNDNSEIVLCDMDCLKKISIV